MTQSEMAARIGFYAGMAFRLLRDDTYARRWLGNAHLLTEETYAETTNEIQDRLVAAGLIAADEDPWESQ